MTMNKIQAKKVLKCYDTFSDKWKIERRYLHKSYVRYVLLAEEFEALKILIK